MGMGLFASLQSSLKARDNVKDVDKAVTDLARRYAARLDEHPDELDDLGPKLLSCLNALLLTPKARAAITKELERDPAESPLDELRQRRSARTRSD